MEQGALQLHLRRAPHDLPVERHRPAHRELARRRRDHPHPGHDDHRRGLSQRRQRHRPVRAGGELHGGPAGHRARGLAAREVWLHRLVVPELHELRLLGRRAGLRLHRRLGLADLRHRCGRDPQPRDGVDELQLRHLGRAVLRDDPGVLQRRSVDEPGEFRRRRRRRPLLPWHHQPDRRPDGDPGRVLPHEDDPRRHGGLRAARHGQAARAGRPGQADRQGRVPGHL